MLVLLIAQSYPVLLIVMSEVRVWNFDRKFDCCHMVSHYVVALEFTCPCIVTTDFGDVVGATIVLVWCLGYDLCIIWYYM